MHVTQPLLESDDRLAARVEAEVAGLDNPGMDRAHRNLMQARTLGLEERVGVRRAVVRLCPPERMPQTPSAVIEPAPVVGRSDRDKAEQIAGRPLEPARRRMKRRHGRKRAALAGDVGESESAALLPQRHPHAVFVAPEADEVRFAGGEPGRGLAPVGFVRATDWLADHRPLFIARVPRRAGTTPQTGEGGRRPPSAPARNARGSAGWRTWRRPLNRSASRTPCPAAGGQARRAPG